MSPLEITLVILLVTIIAFVSGKVPFSVISTGIILALILTGIKTPAEAFGGFINTNVVMFVAMFVIGAGLTKTPLIDKAQSLVIRYKDNMRMLIFLSCVAGAFLGAITSATATAAIMIPLLVGIANDIGVSRSKLLYPSMACANIATQMTFLGQGASNMAWNDVMMQAGAPTPLHIWDFTIARIPMLTMSNLATLTIFIPLVTSACIRMGVDPRAAVVGVITASCVSIMTPMAAPCQIMIIEPGGYTLKDYLKCGTPLALILIVVSVFFLPTLYPFA